MAAVREIMMNRAKVPAKIHAMEKQGSNLPTPVNCASPMRLSSPVVAECGARQASPAPARPPRAPSAGRTPCAADGNKLGKGSRPSSRGEAEKRTPSEPPRNAAARREASSDAPRSKAGVPKAKARSSSASRPKMGDMPPPLERKDVGKVPTYLKKRNEEMAEAKRQAARPQSPQPPPGYRKVEASERESTLAVLKQRKVEAEAAQRKLPFKIETAGQKKREKDLENRLAHINKLIDMFSKPTVFIPADSEPIAASVPPLQPDECERESVAVEYRCPAAGDVARDVEGDMRDVMRRPTSGSGARVPSRESRAAAMAERRRIGGDIAPWDRPDEVSKAPRSGAPPAPSACPWATSGNSPQEANKPRTGVQVAAPPGGVSNFQLG